MKRLIKVAIPAALLAGALAGVAPAAASSHPACHKHKHQHYCVQPGGPNIPLPPRVIILKDTPVH